MSSEKHDWVIRDFNKAVNMAPTTLKKWLDTDESREVGYKGSESSESVGHRSGRHILRIKDKKPSDLTPADFEHMGKVVGYIHRHLAQRPDGDVSETPWRYSLMNWGHDPAKKD